MSRTVTWTPAPGELFRLPETETNVAYAVSVAVEEDDPITGEPTPVAVTGYQGAITPEQPVLDAADTGGELTVSADELMGLFPIEALDYLLGGVLETAGSWDALPEAAEEIIAYKPSTDSERTYTLAVTAQLEDGTEEHAEYSLVILQDWSAGRDLLKEAVDARR